MKLAVLGTGGGWPRAGGANSGYLVRDDGVSIWIDAGSGTLANLLRHCAIGDVDAIFLSHEHLDHVVDAAIFAFARAVTCPALSPIPLIAPSPVIDRLGSLAPEWMHVFSPRILRRRTEISVAHLRLLAFPVEHGIPTYGLRVHARRSDITYLADTAPSDHLSVEARNTNVLIVEATWTLRHQTPGNHLTATDAGRIAREAAADLTLLTHIWPENVAEEQLRRARTTAANQRIELAVEGATYPVRAQE